jgi:peptidoglycan/LPS O-acetylase OafA/YrhL
MNLEAGQGMPQPRSDRDTYLPALDGLRAISILLVVVSHLGLGNVVPGGLGVTIFFFISGFIITRMLLREYARSGRISLSGFYIKRVFRLAPALMVYILLCIVSFAGLGTPIPFLDVLAAIFYAANYYNIFYGWGGAAVDSPLSILWSLAIEEHFYVAFPLALVLMRKRWGKFLVALLTLSVAVLAWRIYLVTVVGELHVSEQRTSTATDTRIDSIAFGCLVSLYTFWIDSVPASSKHRRVQAALGSRSALVAGAAIMIGTLLFRSEEFRQTWRYSLQGVAMAPLFLHLFVFKRRDRIDAFLRSAPMVYIGKISYSLYLYHWLALVFLLQLMRDNPSWQIHLLAVPLMLTLAVASYHVVETPIRRIGHRLAESLVTGTKRPVSEPLGSAPASPPELLAERPPS